MSQRRSRECASPAGLDVPRRAASCAAHLAGAGRSSDCARPLRKPALWQCPCECIQAARGNSTAVQVLPVVIVVIMQIQVLALHGLDIADFDYR